MYLLLTSSGRWVMAAESTSETSVNFYQTTQRYNPKDTHLYTCHHEKLKSYKVYMIFMQDSIQ
jgi:hypothetical protein